MSCYEPNLSERFYKVQHILKLPSTIEFSTKHSAAYHTSTLLHVIEYDSIAKHGITYRSA